MPAAPKPEYFNIAGVRTYVLRAGKGTPVIFLHGLGASSYSWRTLLPELSQRHEVFAMDIPGFGRSDKPADFDYSILGFLKWLLAFMDAFGIERPALVGNSMGGCIALAAALRHPGRVDRMALLGTPPYPHNTPKILFTMNWPVVGPLFAWAMGPWAVPMVARTAFYDKKHVTPEMVGEYRIGLKNADGRRAVVEFVRNAVPPDAQEWIDRYPEIRQPTLVVRGENDSVVDYKSVERFARSLPKATVLHIPKCGHAVQEERPDVMVPALLEFLGARA